MPGIGPNCHELRIQDGTVSWRLMYHVATDAVVVLDVFAKKTATTPDRVLKDCQRRLAQFQAAVQRRHRTRHEN
jgi:phage-related protein